jgi:hypothetical protein
MLRKHNIPQQPGEDYRITLQKAFYTYRSRDRDFQAQITALLKIHEVLQHRVYSMLEVPEFVKDPMEMTDEEFMLFYKNLSSVYEPHYRPFVGDTALMPDIQTEKQNQTKTLNPPSASPAAQPPPKPSAEPKTETKAETAEVKKPLALDSAEQVESINAPGSQHIPGALPTAFIPSLPAAEGKQEVPAPAPVPQAEPAVPSVPASVPAPEPETVATEKPAEAKKDDSA